MLPVPYDSLVAPLVQYQYNNPPAYPMPSLAAEVDPYGPMIAAEIANNVTAKAQKGPARTFCFNMLAVNNWNNPTFKEVIEVVGGHVLIQMARNRINAPQNFIKESVDSIVSLYASKFVTEIIELRSIISAQEVSACLNNYNILAGIINDIKTMRMQRLQQQPQQYYPNPALQQQPMYQGFQQPMQSAPQLSMPNFGGNMQSSIPQFGQVPNNDPTDRFKTTPAPIPVQQPVQPIQTVQVNVQPTKKTIVCKDNKIDISEALDMDRKKHQIIYANQSYNIDSDKRAQIMHEKITKVLDGSEIDEDFYICNNSIIASFEDVAIFEARVISRQLMNTGNNARNYCGQMVIIKPIITTTNFNHINEFVSSGENFADISRRLKSIAESANEQDENVSAYTKEQNVISMYMIIRHYDKHIANSINRFFNIEMGSSIRIDSIMEDGEALCKLVQEKMEPEDYKAFCNFEKELIEVMRLKLESDVIDNLSQDLVNGNDIGLTTIAIPRVYLVIDLLEAELGYKLIENQPYFINQMHEMGLPSDDPHLHIRTMVKFIDYCKQKRGWLSEMDTIVTMDNVKIRVNKCRKTGRIILTKE